MAALATAEDPEAWRQRAACRGVDINVFFPNRDTPDYDAAVEMAKSYCGQCWSKKDCLDWSIRKLGIGEANDDLGIYGGMTFKERRSYVRRQRDAVRRG